MNRPEGNTAAKSVKDPHAGQARLPDLRGTDEIEAAGRRQTGGKLSIFANPKATPTGGEEIPAVTELPEVPPYFSMAEKRPDGKVLVVFAETVHKSPKIFRVLRGLLPAREIAAAICERQSWGEIESDKDIDLIIR